MPSRNWLLAVMVLSGMGCCTTGKCPFGNCCGGCKAPPPPATTVAPPVSKLAPNKNTPTYSAAKPAAPKGEAFKTVETKPAPKLAETAAVKGTEKVAGLSGPLPMPADAPETNDPPASAAAMRKSPTPAPSDDAPLLLTTALPAGMKGLEPPPPVAAVKSASSTPAVASAPQLTLPPSMVPEEIASKTAPGAVKALTAADPAKPTTLADVKPVLPEDLGAKPKAVEESKPTAVADAKPVKTAAKPAAPQKPSEPTLAGYAPDLTKPTPTSVSTGASTFARAEDYSWVQGRLFKVHSGGGYWQIRYQSHDQSDEYGGRFLLTGPAASDLKEGDVVRVEGVVQNYDDRHRTTSYRANNVKVIHKASGSPLAN